MNLKGVKYICGCDLEESLCSFHFEPIDSSTIDSLVKSFPSRDELGRIARETYRKHMFGDHGGLAYDDLCEGDKEMERRVADAIVEAIKASMV